MLWSLLSGLLSESTRLHRFAVLNLYAQDQVAAVQLGADQAAGGATRVTSITMAGISRGASSEMRANQAMLDGSIAAAGQIRDATLQAAKLHMAATIVHHMTRDAARRIEQGLTLRY